jgi:hypothetical protein
MRIVPVLVCLLVALPACRRPKPTTTGMPAPTPTHSEPEPEDDEPAPAPPAPPPPPAKPTSPAPTAEAGFAFGLSHRDSMNLCSTKATWRREGTNYACTAAVESPGFDGTPVLSFCDDRLCAIGIALTPSAPDWQAWDQTFTKMRDALIAKHGAPVTVADQIPDDCKNEKFQQCLEQGKAERELSWTWDTHVTSLRMSRKKSGEGPAAIRFVSKLTAAPIPSAQ